jgi:hypothetical protein
LTAATRAGNIIFQNFVGAPGNPIVFRNCGGKYVLNAGTRSFALKFIGSKYVRITGVGDPAYAHGIEIIGGSQGIQMGGFTSDFEIDHVEIHDPGFAGIMAKTDPDCNSDTDGIYANFVMTNIKIHDNYIHHTGTGEALYIGNSFYSAGFHPSGCTEKSIQPHDVTNTLIYNNRIEYTGAEGIQLGCCRSGCEIYNNVILAYGQNPFNGSTQQANGIQLGEGTGGLCYSNFIHNIPSSQNPITGNAINCLGDNNTVFNNIMIAPNKGMYVNDKPPGTATGPGTGYKIFNNTIVRVQELGIAIATSDVEMNRFKNNIIHLAQGTNFIIRNNVPVDTSNNFYTNNINTLQFEDAAANDYRLKASSPAVNAGANVAAFGVTFDYAGLARPQEGVFDIGAYERAGQTGYPLVNAGADQTITLPVNTATLTGTASDVGGSITSQSWTQVSGPNAAAIQNPGTLSTSVTGLAVGTYKFKLTVTDNTALSASDEIQVIVRKAIPTGPYIVFINAGGDQYTDSNSHAWETDRQTVPHEYYDMSYASLATGSTSTYSGANTTIAPLQTLGTYRYTSGTRTTIQYHIPVPYTGASYKVHLFFARKNGETIVSGQRRFNIILEDTTVRSAYDVFDNTTAGAAVFTYTIAVNDNTLDLSLVAVANAHVQINDIAIERVFTPPVANAGDDKSATLPVSTVQLTGGGTDAGGTIVTYAWQQVSGPGQAVIQSPGSPVTSIFGLVQGLYVFRLTVTDNDNQSQSDSVRVTVHPPAQPWSLSINSGGDAFNDGTRTWERDKQTTPHPYLNTAFPSLTTGSTTTFVGGNNTGAPNQVLGSYRYTSSANRTIKYRIPVPVTGAGYKVDLFFARKGSDTYVAGERKFDVIIEDDVVAANYDIYDNAAEDASVISYTTIVTDDTLNINLIAPVGSHAQINDIAIQKVSDPDPNQTSARVTTTNKALPHNESTHELGWSLYPNPAANYFELLSDHDGPITLQVVTPLQQTVFKTRFEAKAAQPQRFDISSWQTDQLYIIILHSGTHRKIFKLIKSSQ